MALASMLAGSATSMPSMSMWGCFNTIQLITMQAYTSSEMPSNAANLFRSIDEFMRGGALNPGPYLTDALAKNK